MTDVVGTEELVVDATENIELQQLRWKSFTWGRLRKGDCTMEHAELTLFSDGLASFFSSVSTTSSGDVWLFQWLALLGPYDNEVYRIPQFNSPRMAVENTGYFVARDRGTSPLVFPGQLLDVVKKVRMKSHC